MPANPASYAATLLQNFHPSLLCFTSANYPWVSEDGVEPETRHVSLTIPLSALTNDRFPIVNHGATFNTYLNANSFSSTTLTIFISLIV